MSNNRKKKIISIFHECMVWIENSVTRVTDRHHEACRVMPNNDPELKFQLKFKEADLPDTADRFFTLKSNLHKLISFFDVIVCKNQRHLTT